jgi:hypothetical protein
MNRAEVTCEHQTPGTATHRYRCGLGYYGGQPYLGNCIACVAAQDNDPARAAELFARATISHPPEAPPASGCCDPITP